jgi:hypothetical protein
MSIRFYSLLWLEGKVKRRRVSPLSFDTSITCSRLTFSLRGLEYEICAERGDYYILSSFDRGFSKIRFEIEWLVIMHVAHYALNDREQVCV